VQSLRAAEPWNAQPTARQLSGIAGDAATEHEFALRIFVGYSGASPPYGVVKLRSEFLADFHVL